MTQMQYWIWFTSINILPIKKYRLLKEFKEIEMIFNANQMELLKIEGINLIDIMELEKNKKIELIKKYENYINKNGIEVININDKHYPESLKKIYDPPIAIFAKGNLDLLYSKSFAMVGSRDADNYGLKQAYEIAYNLAQNDITIISGLAKGVDKISHLGALNASGNTIAVIGSGLDIVYPKENFEIYQRIIKEGLILSEFIVGTKPDASHFPMRNRIISALSEGILVVQARKKSGAMITVDFALEYGKEIYAIPGNLDNPLSEGCNMLIKDGAKLVTNYEDILEDFSKYVTYNFF